MNRAPKYLILYLVFGSIAFLEAAAIAGYMVLTGTVESGKVILAVTAALLGASAFQTYYKERRRG